MNSAGETRDKSVHQAWHFETGAERHPTPAVHICGNEESGEQAQVAAQGVEQSLPSLAKPKRAHESSGGGGIGRRPPHPVAPVAVARMTPPPISVATKSLAYQPTSPPASVALLLNQRQHSQFVCARARR
jgi:hypothetical protein